jgi:hypothetical protein
MNGGVMTPIELLIILVKMSMYAAFNAWNEAFKASGDNQANEPLIQNTAQNASVRDESGVNKSLSQPTLVLLTNTPNFLSITNFVKPKSARLRAMQIAIRP